jgi:hypothetical protein
MYLILSGKKTRKCFSYHGVALSTPEGTPPNASIILELVLPLPWYQPSVQVFGAGRAVKKTGLLASICKLSNAFNIFHGDQYCQCINYMVRSWFVADCRKGVVVGMALFQYYFDHTRIYGLGPEKRPN